MKEKTDPQGSLGKHPFHLVDPSPWPIVTSGSLLVLAIGAVLWMHNKTSISFYIGLGMTLASAFFWWRDVIRESNTPGIYSLNVEQGLRSGVVLFIASEVMFFGAFFAAYFYSALFPTEAIGNIWPPKGIKTFDPFHLPYFNTLILLLSGTTLTWAHQALLEGKRQEVLQALGITILLGIFFSAVQIIEYSEATFSLKEGIYPSLFFLATGVHGIHVILGTIFLVVCWGRAYRGDFHPKHHVGFEAAAWYWHFVDAVWLFLFISIYWGGYRPLMN